MKPAIAPLRNTVCIMAKTERLQIRISPELKERLQQLADADGRTVSNYIEMLIKNAILERTQNQNDN